MHRFSQGGQYIVVDGNSGAVHLLDEAAFNVVGRILSEPDVTTKDNIGALTWEKAEEQEAAQEVLELIDEGLLFSPDLTEVPPRQDTVVKALCLNVAHDCNMRCQYCFADTGDFGGARELMPFEVAKQAVDFIIEASK